MCFTHPLVAEQSPSCVGESVLAHFGNRRAVRCIRCMAEATRYKQLAADCMSRVACPNGAATVSRKNCPTGTEDRSGGQLGRDVRAQREPGAGFTRRQPRGQGNETIVRRRPSSSGIAARVLRPQSGSRGLLFRGPLALPGGCKARPAPSRTAPSFDTHQAWIQTPNVVVELTLGT